MSANSSYADIQATASAVVGLAAEKFKETLTDEVETQHLNDLEVMVANILAIASPSTPFVDDHYTSNQ